MCPRGALSVPYKVDPMPHGCLVCGRVPITLPSRTTLFALLANAGRPLPSGSESSTVA